MQTFEFATKRVIITGGASGLGLAFAHELASRKCTLLLTDINEAALLAAKEKLEAAGARVFTVAGDVSKATTWDAVKAAAQNLMGGADALINSAGVGVGGVIGAVPLDNWNWIIGINLMGTVLGCHYFAPQFQAQKSGAIINVASLAGILSAPHMGPYNVTKAGVVALSETLYNEMHDTGVMVTVMCPSYFKTNIHVGGRVNTAAEGKFMQYLVTRSKDTAEDMAGDALATAEAGNLYFVPKGEAQKFWKLKRFFPSWTLNKVREKYLEGLSRFS